MPVRVTILLEDNIEDLSAVDIAEDVREHFHLKPASVKVSKLTMRQYKKLMES